MLSHLQESRALLHVTAVWEDKCHSSECLLCSPSLSQLLLLSMMSYGMKYPFGQLGSAVLTVATSASEVFQPLDDGVAGERGECLVSMLVLFTNSQNIGVYGLKSQAQNCVSYSEENQLCPSPSWCNCTAVDCSIHSVVSSEVNYVGGLILS